MPSVLLSKHPSLVLLSPSTSPPHPNLIHFNNLFEKRKASFLRLLKHQESESLADLMQNAQNSINTHPIFLHLESGGSSPFRCPPHPSCLPIPAPQHLPAPLQKPLGCKRSKVCQPRSFAGSSRFIPFSEGNPAIHSRQTSLGNGCPPRASVLPQPEDSASKTGVRVQLEA